MVGIVYRSHEDAIGARNRRMHYRIEVGGERVFFGRKRSNLQIHELLSCIAQIELGVFNVILNDMR